jgi:putative spermidine/putrescine transport system permease protein
MSGGAHPRLPQSLSGAALLAVLACLVAAPLLFLLKLSLAEPHFAAYRAVLASQSLQTVFAQTFKLAFWTALTCMILAVPTASVLHGLPTRWRIALLWLIVTPSFTSYLVRTFAWIAVLGRTGPIQFVGALFGYEDLSLQGTFLGVVIANIHMLLPLSVVCVYIVIDAALKLQLRSAAVLGATPSLRFTAVYIPNMMPGILGGTTVVFLLSAGAFLVPALVGGGRQTTVAQVIYIFATELLDFARSAAIAVMLTGLVVIPALALFFMRSAKVARRDGALRAAWLVARAFAFVADSRIGSRMISICAYGIFAFCLFVIAGPLVYLVLISFQPLPVLALPTGELSLRWYKAVFSDPTWIEAIGVSLRIATAVGFIAVLVGYAAAAVSLRPGGARLQGPMTAVCLAPMAIPGMAFAFGLYGVFLKLHLLGTEAGLIIAHSMVALSFSYVYLRAGLARYDPWLDVAARVLGAGPVRAFLTIRLRLLAPAIGAAFLASFLASFDEIIITLLVAGADVRTLPLRMWTSATQDIGPELAVPGTMIMLLSVFVAIASMSMTETATDDRRRLDGKELRTS